jgi:hypothetical protein
MKNGFGFRQYWSHFAFRSINPASGEWVSLFDGHSLNGWKVGKMPAHFQ